MKHLIYTSGFSLLILLFIAGIVSAETELNDKYYTLKENRGKIIARTAHQIAIGDEYLNSANDLYKVIRIKDNQAIVKLVKHEKLTASTLTRFQQFWSSLFNLSFLSGEVKGKGPIGIYHTHSDESYVKGDGASSKKGNGGIFQVGEVLAKAFEENGVPVVHSKTPHDPHDAMAYDRSRRTAVQLLKDQPTCLLDVHRDAVPAYEYSKTIGNEGVTKVQLVVGKQNPNFQANNDFAKQIKASIDRKYPGFIKGIFYGKGKYNQDLGPRTMLLEFGTNTNSKIAAERSARIFAAAAKNVVFGTSGNRMVNRGSMRSVFWIIAALIVGVGIFLLLNRRNLSNIGKEFTGALGEEETNESQKNNQENNGESS